MPDLIKYYSAILNSNNNTLTLYLFLYQGTLIWSVRLYNVNVKFLPHLFKRSGKWDIYPLEVLLYIGRIAILGIQTKQCGCDCAVCVQATFLQLLLSISGCSSCSHGFAEVCVKGQGQCKGDPASLFLIRWGHPLQQV